MKKFTLKQINEIFRDRDYVTRDRFYHYFRIKYGFDDDRLKQYWSTYEKFPYWDDRQHPVMEDIIEKVSDLIAFMKNGSLTYNVRSSFTPVRKLVHYKTRQGDTDSLDVNFNDTADILLYAEIIKKQYEIIAILDFVEKISRSDKYTDVFDGDVFSTVDTWHSYESGDLFLCDKGTYKKLLYTIGEGYLRDGVPCCDKKHSNYNQHVLTLKDSFHKLGNIYLDASFLIDNNNNDNDNNNE
jgi:hypothetical protein